MFFDVVRVWRTERWIYCMSWVASRKSSLLYWNKQKMPLHCRSPESKSFWMWSRRTTPVHTRCIVVLISICYLLEFFHEIKIIISSGCIIGKQRAAASFFVSVKGPPHVFLVMSDIKCFVFTDLGCVYIPDDPQLMIYSCAVTDF